LDLPQGRLAAHTFHYGSLETALTPAANSSTRFGKSEAFYRHGAIRASFLHFYFPSNPLAAAGLFTA
ncbi:MAG TPA: cobyrinate a,c-diamide synthase, partial [Methylophilaceae bacterium]|nr:cobyrinate a,c-diamide synthase [Methylophilaceae bacterium]